jgi:hypothetical protein
MALSNKEKQARYRSRYLGYQARADLLDTVARRAIAAAVLALESEDQAVRTKTAAIIVAAGDALFGPEFSVNVETLKAELSGVG